MGRRILVVEDATEICATMKDLLEMEGYEVTCASNGLEALQHLESTSVLPDVILLDLMMPRMDGYSFRREQKKRPELSSIPVVVMTAANDVQAKAKALEPAGFLRKPFKDIETILNSIERVL
jgi:two-component system response regulator MprA